MVMPDTFALPVPTPGDAMEVASPAAIGDEDIDIIDFEDDAIPESPQLYDDEHMLEDDDHEALPDDATMYDDADSNAERTLAEDVMQDKPIEQPAYEEEAELIDYDDEEYPAPNTHHQQDASPTQADTVVSSIKNVNSSAIEPPSEPPAEEHITEVAHEAVPHSENAVEEFELDFNLTSETSIQQQHDYHRERTASHEDTQGAEQVVDSGAALENEASGSATPEALYEATTPTRASQEAASRAEHDVLQHEDDSAHDEAHAQPEVLPVDTALHATTDGPPTPTDTGLHPIILRYQGLWLPLFRSRAHRNGLLTDDNLASVSLAELMQNCKQRISKTSGVTMSEGQVSHIRIDQLGLILCETEPAASDTSLNDVLEVYLQLHENSVSEEIPPLALRFGLHNDFASAFNLLRYNAFNADKRAGISDVPSLIFGEEYYSTPLPILPSTTNFVDSDDPANEYADEHGNNGTEDDPQYDEHSVHHDGEYDHEDIELYHEEYEDDEDQQEGEHDGVEESVNQQYVAEEYQDDEYEAEQYEGEENSGESYQSGGYTEENHGEQQAARELEDEPYEGQEYRDADDQGQEHHHDTTSEGIQGDHEEENAAHDTNEALSAQQDSSHGKHEHPDSETLLPIGVPLEHDTSDHTLAAGENNDGQGPEEYEHINSGVQPADNADDVADESVTLAETNAGDETIPPPDAEIDEDVLRFDDDDDEPFHTAIDIQESAATATIAVDDDEDYINFDDDDVAPAAPPTKRTRDDSDDLGEPDAKKARSD